MTVLPEVLSPVHRIETPFIDALLRRTTGNTHLYLFANRTWRMGAQLGANIVKQVLQTVYGSHIDPHRHCLKMLPVEIFWLFIELLLVTTCKVSAIPTIRPKEEFQSSLGDSSQILEAGLGHGSAKRHKTMSETGPENWQVSNLPPGNAFFPTYMPQVPFHGERPW
jgi:hypothetical protein